MSQKLTSGDVEPGGRTRSGWLIISRLVLWLAVSGVAVLAAAMFFDRGGDAAGRGLGQAFGLILGVVAAAGLVALVLAFRWRGWLWVAAAIVALPAIGVVTYIFFGLFEEGKQDHEMADMASGKADFWNDPKLLTVAQAIARNDPDAIRAAARNLPNLNSAGADGKTLLYFAVDQALERPERIAAVQTLLSLGIDPNYNNGQINSFALWRAVSGPVALLRAMLDAGGNPNGLDFRGNPIIFWNWELTFNTADRPARFHLLLERGADINSTYAANSDILPGYSLVMARVNSGNLDPAGYSDAIELLERGADPRTVAADGTTLVKLVQRREYEYAESKTTPPSEFQALHNWMIEHHLFEAEAN